MVRALLAEAQFDPELAKAFHEKWTLPRRKLVHEILEKALEQGEFRKGLDIEASVDAFYGPIYYRLLMWPGQISEVYVDRIFSLAMDGQRQI